MNDASLQLLPNLFRYGLISLVEAHNGGAPGRSIKRKGSPNNGLWLGIAGTDEMARVYKVSRRYTVRRSGNVQERLITQGRYRDLLLQPELYETTEPRLDALLMWQSHGFELTAAYVIIPNGWDDEDHLVTIGKAEVDVPSALSDLAAFAGADDDTSLIRTDMPIFAPTADLNEDADEPFEDDEDLGAYFESPEEGLGDLSNPEDKEDS